MQTFKKNQIIITALVIMIAIAGYLNFTDKGTDGITEALNQQEEQEDSKETTSPAIVPNSEKADSADTNNKDATQDATNDAATEPPKEAEKTTTDATTTEESKSDGDAKETTSDDTESNVGEAIFTNKSNVEAGYFLRAKIGREQGYAMLKEGYLSLIDNKNLKEEQKVKAVQEMIDLQDRIEKEAAAESLLEAKGFKDVFVRMLNGKVDVVINAKELSQAEFAQIEDIVRRQTGVDAENVVINLLDISKAK